MADLDARVNEQIRTKLEKDVFVYKKELRNVKNVLRIPRLTEKYRETLKSIERKEVIDQFCIEQFKPLDGANMSRDEYCTEALNSALQLQLGQVMNIKTSTQIPDETVVKSQQ